MTRCFLLPRFVAAFLMLIWVAGCADPEISLGLDRSELTRDLRPDLTAAEFNNRKPIPDGLRRTYLREGILGEVEFAVKHQNQPDGSLAVLGEIRITPPGVELAEIARQLDASEKLEGSAAALVKNGRIVLPMRADVNPNLQLKELSGIGITRYEPHDCSFVIGECIYQLVESGAPRRRVTVRLDEQDGIWHMIEIGPVPGTTARAIIREFYATYDQFGLITRANGVELTGQGYSSYTIRLK